MEKKIINALAKKYRFQSRVGLISTEDLFDLNKQDLSMIYKILSKGVVPEEASLMPIEDDAKTTIVKDKMEIVKIVFDYKAAQEKEAIENQLKNEKRQKLLAIYNRKQDSNLENLELDEIKKMLDEL